MRTSPAPFAVIGLFESKDKCILLPVNKRLKKKYIELQKPIAAAKFCRKIGFLGIGAR